MKTVLLLHHGRAHFEVVLALNANLCTDYQMHLWSNYLHVFGRRALLPMIDIGLYEEELTYDYIIVISGDQGPLESEVPLSLWRLLQKSRVARVIHRFYGASKPGEIYLFGNADRPFIPVLTGLNFPLTTNGAPNFRRQMLIQGNIENRRNYDLVKRVAGSLPGIDMKLCGIRVNDDLGNGTNITQYNNLDEIDFHRHCANSDFILPMVDPTRYSGYFRDRFSSSIQIGFAYSLPFIAHKALFDIYPIVGLPYETDEEFFGCVSQAATLDDERLATIRNEISLNRDMISGRNKENIAGILAAAPIAY